MVRIILIIYVIGISFTVFAESSYSTEMKDEISFQLSFDELLPEKRQVGFIAPIMNFLGHTASLLVQDSILISAIAVTHYSYNHPQLPDYATAAKYLWIFGGIGILANATYSTFLAVYYNVAPIIVNAVFTVPVVISGAAMFTGKYVIYKSNSALGGMIALWSTLGGFVIPIIAMQSVLTFYFAGVAQGRDNKVRVAFFSSFARPIGLSVRF